MPIWRYIAVELNPPGASPSRRRGEISAASAAEVRASLRRIGLQAIDVRPARMRIDLSSWRVPSIRLFAPVGREVRDRWNAFLRKRRCAVRAELFDSLATMIESGLPLAEAVDALVGEANEHTRRLNSNKPLRRMLIELRESIGEGSTLAQCMRAHPAWFGVIDIAMIDAATHAGTLPSVLRSLTDREERTDELTQKLFSALMYPSIVLLAAIGVAVFLSTKTLPDLTGILVEGGVEVPRLTNTVMFIGQVLAQYLWLIALGVVVMLAGIAGISRALANRNEAIQRRLIILRPRVWRSMNVGSLAINLADLIHAGIPMVDALRVIAPTMPSALRSQLGDAADRIERGESLADVFDDPQWFTTEFRRLIETAHIAGDMAPMLERIGERYHRQSRRLIDRLATLLEPAAIIVLAIIVGTVVMAAILPLIRLKEVIG